MSGVILGIAIGGVFVGGLAVALVHYGYAAQNHRAAKAAVPPARRIRIARGVDVLRWLALVAIVAGIRWAYGGRDE